MDSEKEAWKQWARDYAKEWYLKNKERKQVYCKDFTRKIKNESKQDTKNEKTSTMPKGEKIQKEKNILKCIVH